MELVPAQRRVVKELKFLKSGLWIELNCDDAEPLRSISFDNLSYSGASHHL